MRNLIFFLSIFFVTLTTNLYSSTRILAEDNFGDRSLLGGKSVTQAGIADTSFLKPGINIIFTKHTTGTNTDSITINAIIGADSVILFWDSIISLSNQTHQNKSDIDSVSSEFQYLHDRVMNDSVFIHSWIGIVDSRIDSLSDTLDVVYTLSYTNKQSILDLREDWLDSLIVHRDSLFSYNLRILENKNKIVNDSTYLIGKISLVDIRVDSVADKLEILYARTDSLRDTVSVIYNLSYENRDSILSFVSQFENINIKIGEDSTFLKDLIDDLENRFENDSINIKTSLSDHKTAIDSINLNIIENKNKINSDSTYLDGKIIIIDERIDSLSNKLSVIYTTVDSIGDTLNIVYSKTYINRDSIISLSNQTHTNRDSIILFSPKIQNNLDSVIIFSVKIQANKDSSLAINEWLSVLINSVDSLTDTLNIIYSLSYENRDSILSLIIQLNNTNIKVQNDSTFLKDLIDNLEIRFESDSINVKILLDNHKTALDSINLNIEETKDSISVNKNNIILVDERIDSLGNKLSIIYTTIDSLGDTLSIIYSKTYINNDSIISLSSQTHTNRDSIIIFSSRTINHKTAIDSINENISGLSASSGGADSSKTFSYSIGPVGSNSDYETSTLTTANLGDALYNLRDTGGTIFIKGGTYNISSTIVLSTNDVITERILIIGEKGRTKISIDNTVSLFAFTSTSTNNLRKLTICNIEFFGAGGLPGFFKTNASSGDSITIDNCLFTGFSMAAATVFSLNSSSVGWNLINNIFSTNYKIKFTGYNSLITNNHFNMNTRFEILGKNNIIENNIFNSSTDISIYLDDFNGDVDNAIIRNNIFFSINSSYCISTSGAKRILIENNIFGVPESQNLVGGISLVADSSIIRNNYFYGISNTAIYVQDSANTLSGNHFKFCNKSISISSLSGTYRTVLSNNSFENVDSIICDLGLETIYGSLIDLDLGMTLGENSEYAPGTAGENLVYGNVCYLKSDGKYYKADADSSIWVPASVIALGTINTDVKGLFFKSGEITNPAWSFTTGQILYLSASVGEITASPPETVGDQIQILGYAKSATKIDFKPNFMIIERE